MAPRIKNEGLRECGSGDFHDYLYCGLGSRMEENERKHSVGLINVSPRYGNRSLDSFRYADWSIGVD
jgi:hypothetical protein